MLPLIVLALCAAPQGEYVVPEGFRVERASDLARSFLALTFDELGRPLVSVEGGPILVLEDRDGDRVYETDRVFAEVESAQGLLWLGGVLYASGRREAQDGLWRVVPKRDLSAAEKIELVLPVVSANGGDSPGEHGAHGVVVGPDGFLYWVLGDHARIATEPAADLPLRSGKEGSVLPPLYDPNGHALHVRYPCGYIARVDPRTAEWRYVAVGLRNCYDLAFDTAGELFTFDSDMEWDVGLPWYRPCRFLHVVEGGDFGSRSGSAMMPSWYFDTQPPLLEVGRGSPAGLVFCGDERFGEAKRDTLIAADWSQGRILALHFARDVGALTGSLETLLQARHGLNVTDIAWGPDEALYLVSGGRGTVGKLERLVYSGPSNGGAGEPGSNEHRSRAAGNDVRSRARSALPGDVPGLLQSLDESADDETALIVLRSLELASILDPATAALLSEPRTLERLLRKFPGSDRRASRELAILLAKNGSAASIDALLEALAGESNREQQIHYAYCLSAIESGWTPERARALLDWFDRSETWTGGLSFQGYLLAMRARLASRFTTEEKLALANSLPLGGRTLAHFMDGLEPAEVDRLVAPLQYAWARASEGRDADAAREERAGILRDLGAARSPKLAAFLRRKVDEAGSPRDEALAALARAAEELDGPALAAGLESERTETVETCARALLALAWKPDGPEPVRMALAAARELGSGRGGDALALAARWTGAALPSSASADWNAALAAAERGFRARFPEAALQAEASLERPAPSFDQILAFLERSEARKGSPARGREAFVEAACATCHVVEGSGLSIAVSGWGPELATAAQRFSRRDLLEAIVHPSRAISDQYRTTILVTRDEEHLEGRVIAEDADGVELRASDGGTLRIPRADIAERRLAELSTMPEGLLAALDLEEIKDLFAFLEAGGRVTDASASDFEPLFAKKSRNQWNGDRAHWRIDGDVAIGQTQGLTANDYLVSKDSYGDFELAFDARLSLGANSGVQVRSRIVEGQTDPLGPQADLGQVYWGSLYTTDGRGIVKLADEKIWRAVVEPTGWNHVFVRCLGDCIAIEINGATTVDVSGEASQPGVLAFQLHQGPPMEARIANAKVRRLP